MIVYEVTLLTKQLLSYDYNSRIWEVEIKGSRVQGQSWLLNKPETSCVMWGIIVKTTITKQQMFEQDNLLIDWLLYICTIQTAFWYMNHQHVF